MWLLAQHPSMVGCNQLGLFPVLKSIDSWWSESWSFAGKTHVIDHSLEDDPYTKSDIKELLREDESSKFLRPLASHVFNKIADCKPTAEFVVIQTPENVKLVESILKVFPDAYILHIVRDPRSVFASMRAAAKDWGKQNFSKHAVDGAREWSEDVAAGLQSHKLTTRYREVRYESLITDGAAELEEIFEWFELDSNRLECEEFLKFGATESMRHRNVGPTGFVRRAKKDSWRNELTRSDIRVVEYIAGDLMRELGYECENDIKMLKPLQIRIHEFRENLINLCMKFMSRRILRKAIKSKKKLTNVVSDAVSDATNAVSETQHQSLSAPVK